MRLLIAAIGKLKDDAEREICARYAKRLDAAGKSLALGPLETLEFAESRAASVAARKTDEAQRLLHATQSVTQRIALEVTGKALTSEAFAEMLRARRDGGSKSIAFLIGGPDGHGQEALAACELKLSLGPLTLPHGLARVVLTEQIYRAATIIAGHPYHRA